MSLAEPPVGREGVCLAGGRGELSVPARLIRDAVPVEEIERYRALLPQGFSHAAEAYRLAARDLTARDLSEHYGEGQRWFHETFVPYVKEALRRLTGGAWDLRDYLGFAASGDVDLMTHLINASEDCVAIYPGDWGGFFVGPSNPKVAFAPDSRGAFACLCLPSVRNGRFTEEMLRFCAESRFNLLNLNLFPTLTADERREIALALNPMLDRTILSISFSRGFSLTASQLGFMLVHPAHPLLKWRKNWEWFTLFYNAVAARAFMHIDLDEVERVNALRRREVEEWHARTGVPYSAAGSYYVKSFRVDGDLPADYAPLTIHDGLLRLCFKPQSE